MDIFQHSPLCDVLSSLKYLSLSGDSWPNYVRLKGEADDEEIHYPPTTHLIATVDDLTDMLDFDSGDIDGMDDDAGEEQEPSPTGRWAATSSYVIYMVDTPKESDGNKATEDNPLEKQSKNRRQRRRSKPRKTAIPAQETTTLRIVPKTKTIPSSQASSWRMGKLALRNRQLMENRRMTITCLSPKTR